MRRRSTEIERVGRINRAVNLLRKLRSSQKAIACLRGEYGMSRPQAYRYVQEAEKSGKVLALPEEKVVVIVKLPVSMIERVRMLKREKSVSIVGIITEALRIYLKENGI